MTNRRGSNFVSRNEKYNADEVSYVSVKPHWMGKFNRCKASVSEKYFYEHKGTKYFVEGKSVILDYSSKEQETANLLATALKVNVELLPKVRFPQSVNTPDFLIDGEKFDLKEIFGDGKNVIDGAIRHGRPQASNFVLNVSETPLSICEIYRQINRIYANSRRKWLKQLIIIRDDMIIDILDRNNKNP